MAEDDPWRWLKTFLKPLNNDWKPTPSTKTVKPSRSNCSAFDDGPLVGKFMSDLGRDHRNKSGQKSAAVYQAKQSLIGSLVNPPLPFQASLFSAACSIPVYVLHRADSYPMWRMITESTFGEELFQELERRWKRYEEAKNMKSDREKSGSMWTIEMLESYIKQEDIAFLQPESSFDLTGEALQKICERVDLAIKAVCGREGTVEKLNQLHSQPNSTEFDTRMILDAILQPLCVYKGLRLRCEQTIKSGDLPTNRYDFIMYYNLDNVDHPIGVVEAKRQGCLKDESVPQLLVQLLLLSSEEPNWFYFGVLSDAYRFIFAGVSHQKVWFFQTNNNQLEITTVKSDHDVRSIVGKISWLIDLAIQSRKSSTPIEHFLARIDALKIKESYFQNDEKIFI